MAAVSTVGIVGSGAAGLTAASLLADAGIDVEILEKAEGPSPLGLRNHPAGQRPADFRQLWHLGRNRGEGLRRSVSWVSGRRIRREPSCP